MKLTIWAVSLLVLCDSAAAATVRIEPTSTTTSLGGMVNLAVTVTDVIDLYAYQFELSFAPTVLSAGPIMEGGFLRSGGNTFFFPGTSDNISGAVALTASALQGAAPGVSGSGTLATMLFSSVGFGASPVTLSNAVLLDSMGQDIPTTLQNGSVTVVPEPGSVALFGCGLLWGVVARTRGGRSRRR